MGVLLALQLPWMQREHRMAVQPSRLGPWVAPVMGMTFAFGWTPCITPVLAAVLGLASSGGTLARGEEMLVAYSLGLGVPVRRDRAGLWPPLRGAPFRPPSLPGREPGVRARAGRARGAHHHRRSGRRSPPGRPASCSTSALAVWPPAEPRRPVPLTAGVGAVEGGPDVR